MRRTFILFFLLAFIINVAAAQEEFSANVSQYIKYERGTIALENVTVIDGTGSPASPGQTILIENSRISAVGPVGEVAIPEGAQRIDLTDHTVIPGLIGLHDHTYYTTSQRQIQLSFSAPMLYLASGVTTIRTTGSYAPYAELSLKRTIDRGAAVGPKIFATGPYITGGTGMSTMSQLKTAEDARRVVRYWAEEGVSWFKAYTLISRAELGAAIDEAHKRGVKVTGHLCSVTFKEAVALGIDNLEHGFFTNTDYDPNKELDECPGGFRTTLAEIDISSPEVQETFKAMIDAGVGMTSTLAVYEMFIPNRPPLEQRVLDAMSPEVRQEFLQTRAQISEKNNQLWGKLFKKALEFEYAFVQAGGTLAAGVDPTGYGGALPGYGDQRNYELLLEGGFTPVEAVQIISANGAKILEIYDNTGSIEVGKLADLVVIDGDIEAYPASIRKVRYVFREGAGFDSELMIEAVQGLVGIQ
ncbi:MAG: amidohydrolase family protein [Rhodothermia bacterium]|nr:MAG: amidohydrolase family protein [Rhodothermia bacterium]